jgi:hypothetical protein
VRTVRATHSFPVPSTALDGISNAPMADSAYLSGVASHVHREVALLPPERLTIGNIAIMVVNDSESGKRQRTIP